MRKGSRKQHVFRPLSLALERRNSVSSLVPGLSPTASSAAPGRMALPTPDGASSQSTVAKTSWTTNPSLASVQSQPFGTFIAARPSDEPTIVQYASPGSSLSIGAGSPLPSTGVLAFSTLSQPSATPVPLVPPRASSPQDAASPSTGGGIVLNSSPAASVSQSSASSFGATSSDATTPILVDPTSLGVRPMTLAPSTKAASNPSLSDVHDARAEKTAEARSHHAHGGRAEKTGLAPSASQIASRGVGSTGGASPEGPFAGGGGGHTSGSGTGGGHTPGSGSGSGSGLGSGSLIAWGSGSGVPGGAGSGSASGSGSGSFSGSGSGWSYASGSGSTGNSTGVGTGPGGTPSSTGTGDDFWLTASGGGWIFSNGDGLDQVGSPGGWFVRPYRGGINYVTATVDGAWQTYGGSAASGLTTTDVPTETNFGSGGFFSDFFRWNATPGIHTIAVTAFFTDGTDLEKEVRVDVEAPTLNKLTITSKPFVNNTNIETKLLRFNQANFANFTPGDIYTAVVSTAGIDKRLGGGLFSYIQTLDENSSTVLSDGTTWYVRNKFAPTDLLDAPAGQADQGNFKYLNKQTEGVPVGDAKDVLNIFPPIYQKGTNPPRYTYEVQDNPGVRQPNAGLAYANGEIYIKAFNFDVDFHTYLIYTAPAGVGVTIGEVDREAKFTATFTPPPNDKSQAAYLSKNNWNVVSLIPPDGLVAVWTGAASTAKPRWRETAPDSIVLQKNP
jgi:hypothetical protein